MIEQEHHHKIVLEETEGLKQPIQEGQNSGMNLIAGSILLSAILISGSIVYSANLSSQSQPGQQAATAQQQDQNAPAQQPSGPVTVADRAKQPTLGSTSAKVTIVEFGDFQCPFCKNFFQNTFSQIKTKYIDTGKVKYVFRHFPLTQIHVNAQIASVAAECANQQGQFWAYHDVLYTQGQADGSNLDKASLEKYADQLGLNKGILGLGKNIP